MDQKGIGYIERDDEYSLKRRYTSLTIYKTRVPTDRAEFAMAMIERWGMVAGMPDGEDSAGRSKLRLADPAELVARACLTAELAFAEIDRRGWMLSVPAPSLITKEEETA